MPCCISLWLHICLLRWNSSVTSSLVYSLMLYIITSMYTARLLCPGSPLARWGKTPIRKNRGPRSSTTYSMRTAAADTTWPWRIRELRINILILHSFMHISNTFQLLLGVRLVCYLAYCITSKINTFGWLATIGIVKTEFAHAAT